MSKQLGNNRASYDPIAAAIEAIRHDDPDRSVDALKQLQVMLDQDSHAFMDSAQTLADALLDQLDLAFTPPENLHEARYFRLVKHILQACSQFSSNQDLMRRLTYDDIYAMLSGLTLHLIQADRMGGIIGDMTQFMNMILIQTLATPDRLMVFKAMFRLLLSITQDFSTLQVQPDSEAAAHGDLVLKCLWKRCKILDDDLRSGRLRPGPLICVLEEFVQGVSPAAWRRRKDANIALGDMPLRTIKTILQKVVGECWLLLRMKEGY